jgi:hypothetical protein
MLNPRSALATLDYSLLNTQRPDEHPSCLMTPETTCFRRRPLEVQEESELYASSFQTFELEKDARPAISERLFPTNSH